MKNNVINKAMAKNGKIIKKILLNHGLDYCEKFKEIIENYVSNSHDENVNIMPIIKQLKRIEGHE